MACVFQFRTVFKSKPSLRFFRELRDCAEILVFFVLDFGPQSPVVRGWMHWEQISKSQPEYEPAIQGSADTFSFRTSLSPVQHGVSLHKFWLLASTFVTGQVSVWPWSWVRMSNFTSFQPNLSKRMQSLWDSLGFLMVWQHLSPKTSLTDYGKLCRCGSSSAYKLLVHLGKFTTVSSRSSSPTYISQLAPSFNCRTLQRLEVIVRSISRIVCETMKTLILPRYRSDMRSYYYTPVYLRAIQETAFLVKMVDCVDWSF